VKYRDSADEKSSGRFAGKVRLPTVDTLTEGTSGRLVPTERRDLILKHDTLMFLDLGVVLRVTLAVEKNCLALRLNLAQSINYICRPNAEHFNKF